MKQVLRSAFVAVFAALVMLPFSGIVSAQQKTEVKILKPKMPISEVAFAATLLDGVEIRGGEVDAFVDARKVLMTLLQKATDEKKQPTDVVVVEMNISQAQNILALLQRAKLTGGDAERYKKFVDTVVESAK
ncbi:MAG TPA: hypothetical protein PLW09_09785 [Candidatus Kapabacteria bacterium]|jgi:hypothetical protein|nr:hypothetical protein [Candidatus Kapabacteria bacterium]HRK60574.1 hypothetical protein [Candidatus Kapabacteria bacterium]